ncbi:hypothetical protein Pla123a_47260 [Posidoniimonas polymericola]|uniref:DUF2961 domain-containing protein n=1 Tax=Posidoniimonas polymericola TaxID=2528002 RepID=A0A5C5XXM2_9BACT|nr:glycoside hydrolase family 172 protein [Posidoniimonas polymericola]TWT66332.1 hypothetical protein Pla123a_47260 [Posidoniimonas polymericola]
MRSSLTTLLLFVSLAPTTGPASAQPPEPLALYDLSTPLVSRAVTAENPTGEPGAGGQAASALGPGRKGAPNFRLPAGETHQLCDIEGNGSIRHIWMTGSWQQDDQRRTTVLRSVVLRGYWDGQEHPSIECPIGDFMGGAHSKSVAYQSAAHSVGESAAFNFWLPMPFTSRARLTITNDSDLDVTIYYQVDYTLGDNHPDNVGRMHANFRRANPTTPGEDFELLPKRTGKGRFLGAVMGVRTLHPGWWGEGEMKAYLDGDDKLPTICGTGSEDYVGLSYGMQNTTHRYHGCSLLEKSKAKFPQLDIPQNETVETPAEYISMYRWHLPDPIYWKTECRITIQQIGCCYYERDDDWSTASFWYEPVPSEPLGPFPSNEDRTADLAPLLDP